MISVRNLDKYFNKGKTNELHVLRDLSLELPEKGMVAVFGRSGCGKTTFLNTLGGLDGFAGGDVLVEGESIRKHTDRIRNEKIGFIFQNYNLHKTESVFDNVAYALRLAGLKDKDEIEKRVLAALKNVGMSKFRGRTPDTLSGGQQQRVAIARAIVKNPPIILADEPTGNLDDANTLLVMDLLRQIAEDHLVVLVTHEAKLVDRYCDTVVELSDGQLVNVRQNDLTQGVTARSRGDIYLGELAGSLDEGRFARIACYGEAPETPVKLTLVRNGGKTYLRIDSPGVQLVDESSEVQLKAGVYREEEQAKRQAERIDMSELPTLHASGKTGRLFGLRQSLRSGFEENFRKKKKKKNKLLRAAMVLFSAVFVMLAAYFGVAIRDIKEVDAQFDKQLFYVRLSHKDTAVRLEEALKDPASGLDGMYCSYLYDFGTKEISFTPGYFETFGTSLSGDGIGTDVVRLSQSLLKDAKLLAGTPDAADENAIVLSSAAADRMLEAVSYGYISSYKDLLGLRSRDGQIIRAVVESAEPAVYLTDTALADAIFADSTAAIVREGQVTGLRKSLAAGETVLVQQYDDKNVKKPAVGETVMIYGQPFTVKAIREISEDDPEDAGFYRENKWYGNVWKECICYQDVFFLVNDEDLVRLSRSFGKTDNLADSNCSFDEEGRLQGHGRFNYRYATLHAGDAAAAEAYLTARFGEAESVRIGETNLVTPASQREELMRDRRDSIRRNLIGMGVMLAILSLCMYFMMRASLMGRIREVGIYRAIGVTKGNMKFRFLAESAVLTGLTVLLGYLLASAALFYWLDYSTLMSKLFYYPLWLALLVLAVLAVLCLFCGTLPVSLLLRKTPSEILAKYDI